MGHSSRWQRTGILTGLLLLGVAGVVRAADYTVVRASVTLNGVQGNQYSRFPSMNADGRYVAFESIASNLVSGDTNNSDDVFVKDVTSGTLVRASTTTSGAQLSRSQSPSISASGRYVAFQSGAFTSYFIYVKDMVTGVLVQANVSSTGQAETAMSGEATLSADGRYVAFWSFVNNLVPNDTNGTRDIFVKDLVSGSIVRANLSATGAEANSSSHAPRLSGNGRYVAFVSDATNLVAGAGGNQWDVFVKDLVTGAIVIGNTSATGQRAIANGAFAELALSADGRYLVFQSGASNLVPNDTNNRDDVFVKDLTTGAISRANVSAVGEQMDEDAYQPEISADGNHVVFRTGSPTGSVFQKDLLTGALRQVVVTHQGYQSSGGDPTINADGRHVAFTSAGILVPEDTNGRSDVYVSRSEVLAGAPSGINAVAVASNRVDVTWVDDFLNETGFEVWASTDGAPLSLLTTLARNVQYFRHVGITGSHTFQYQVRALYGSSPTDFSNTATAIVMAQPLGLNAQALDSGQVQLRWNDHATNEAGYQIWRGVGAGAFAYLASAPANSVTYTDNTVAGNQTYRYQLRAVNTIHASSYTNADTVPVMLAPTNLAGNAVSSTRIDLSWTDNSAGLEGGFQIYRRQGFNAFKLVGSVGANVTSYSDTTVNGGQPYDYAVRAVNIVDWSSFTPVIKVTTP